MTEVDWQAVRLVVFDVDGTLYDQGCLRQKMMIALLGHCLRHPGDVGILRVISQYRKFREELAEEEAEGIGELQYQRPAQRLGLEPEEVRTIVERWMLERPLEHLGRCRYPSVEVVFKLLEDTGRRVAVLSDYPAGDKLAALGLEAEIQVSAVDPEVDRLKPHPRGLQRVLEVAGVDSGAALLIGDRDERDGECARRAGVACLIKTSQPTAKGAHFGDYEEVVRILRTNPARDAALQ